MRPLAPSLDRFVCFAFAPWATRGRVERAQGQRRNDRGSGEAPDMETLANSLVALQHHTANTHRRAGGGRRARAPVASRECVAAVCTTTSKPSRTRANEMAVRSALLPEPFSPAMKFMKGLRARARRGRCELCAAKVTHRTTSACIQSRLTRQTKQSRQKPCSAENRWASRHKSCSCTPKIGHEVAVAHEVDSSH